MTHDGQQTSYFCRNNREIARALGLRQSRRQLAEIGAWRARADFPKKTSRGYDRTELLQWSARYAKELAQLNALSKALSRKNTTARDQRRIEELAAPAGDGVYPKQVSGQPAIAAIVAAHFAIQCQRQHVQRWRSQAPAPFPAPDAAGRYDVGESLAWVEKWIISRRTNDGTADLFQRAHEAEQQGKIDREEHEKFRRAIERGQYIERTLADRTTVGAIKRYHQLVRQRIERYGPEQRAAQLRALGIAPNQLRQFEEFDLAQSRSIIDDIEAQCHQLASPPETNGTHP